MSGCNSGAGSYARCSSGRGSWRAVGGRTSIPTCGRAMAIRRSCRTTIATRSGPTSGAPPANGHPPSGHRREERPPVPRVHREARHGGGRLRPSRAEDATGDGFIPKGMTRRVDVGERRRTRRSGERTSDGPRKMMELTVAIHPHYNCDL